MNVRVQGANKKLTKKEVRYAVRWYSCKLMSKKLSNNLTINIEFLHEKGLKGSTVSIDSDYRPREFKIRIDPNLSRKNQLLTLAHEITHVKQFATGEMQYTSKYQWVKWNKQAINNENVDYWDLPWEIEAFGREYGLYIRYVEHIYKNKIKF